MALLSSATRPVVPEQATAAYPAFSETPIFRAVGMTGSIA